MVSRFRVKKLSPKHPLPIYKESQLPDIGDAANVQRSVPQIETGVEKEEEEEHDLQAAISAAHAAVTTGAKIERYIPTPDASRQIPDKEYHQIYKKRFKEPTNLIRFSATVEDTIGCPYVMDEEDEAFLKKHSELSVSEDDFEKIMWQYETACKEHWPHLNLDPSQTPSFVEMQKVVPEKFGAASMEPIFNHWRERRIKRNGQTIIPELKYEDILKNEIDPYVCFRRRETKPVRKTRRTDQQSLERLRKLRSEMEMSRNLLEMVLRREKIRKEGLVLEHSVFEKKCKLREYQRLLGIKEDDDLLPLSKKKRKTESGGSGATIKIPLNKLRRDGMNERSPMQAAIEAELARKKEQDAGYEDVTECPYQPFPVPLSHQFFQSLSSDKNAPRFRKRVGRGGRVMIDRVGYPRAPLQTGGKTEPSAFQQNAYDRYRFDSDSSDDEELMEVDETDDQSLQQRSKLLSEVDLRNLLTIPFMTPLNLMARSNQSMANGQPNRNGGLSSLPIKRQNSRTKMTPQQAAVAMANGMIATNMAAALNGGQNKAAMQMAMAAAQQNHAGNASPMKQSITSSPHVS